MNYRITLVPGDGIGPEIIAAGQAVLEHIAARFGHTFSFTEVLAGGAAIDALDEPLPEATVRACWESDAVLLGAVGGPKWDHVASHLRPEQAILGLRQSLGLYANLRPVKLFPALAGESPLRPDIVAGGIDLVIVRELTGGVYYGKRGRSGQGNERAAFDTETYAWKEIERIARAAFALALQRRKKLTSVDKANVLDTSKLWREVLHEVAKDYPTVEYNDLYVDNAAMQLIRAPYQFDVVVTSNLFGDILSDEASVLAGSIGLLPSASLADGSFGLYEPIHGSAPDIAGQGKANPVGTILSAAMLLRLSLHLAEEAAVVESAVEDALAAGFRTADVAATAGTKLVSTAEMTAEICRRIAG